jgi:tetratricopeptide (TPR) repeat protein
MRAAVFFRQHDDAAAYADLRHAIALSPADIYCFTARSYYRRGRGDYAGALADATTAINLEPDLGMPHAERARAEEKLGRWREARDDWQKALDLGWDAKYMKDYRKGLERASAHLKGR